MIYCDTREKKWSHIKDYFDKNEIKYESKKLEFGDYQNSDYPSVVIDRKASLEELVNNLVPGSNNFTRFMKEIRKAYTEKGVFIILIEKEIQSWEELKQWKSYWSNYDGKWLYAKMKSLSKAYNVHWIFCNKKETAERILKYTKYEL